MNSLYGNIIFFILVSSAVVAQNPNCTYFDSFDIGDDWTQVGELIEISDGSVNFIDGASNKAERRIYRLADLEFNVNESWNISLSVTTTNLGTLGNMPAFSIIPIGISQSNSDPNTDCPQSSCDSYPPPSHDGIYVVFGTLAPPDSRPHFKLSYWLQGVRWLSDQIYLDNFQSTYYINFSKLGSTYSLGVFTDSELSIELSDSPVTLESSCLTEFQYFQISTTSFGDVRREFTGQIDNLCYTSLATTCDIDGICENGTEIWDSATCSCISDNSYQAGAIDSINIDCQTNIVSSYFSGEIDSTSIIWFLDEQEVSAMSTRLEVEKDGKSAICY